MIAKMMHAAVRTVHVKISPYTVQRSISSRSFLLSRFGYIDTCSISERQRQVTTSSSPSSAAFLHASVYMDLRLAASECCAPSIPARVAMCQYH